MPMGGLLVGSTEVFAVAMGLEGVFCREVEAFGKQDDVLSFV